MNCNCECNYISNLWLHHVVYCEIVSQFVGADSLAKILVSEMHSTVPLTAQMKGWWENHKQRDPDQTRRVSQMKMECKFNVPTAEGGANPLPHGLSGSHLHRDPSSFHALCCNPLRPDLQPIHPLSRYTSYTVFSPRCCVYRHMSAQQTAAGVSMCELCCL